MDEMSENVPSVPASHDGDNLVEETNATGGVVARYSQGLNIDDPLAMVRSGATSYYQVDGLGSVTALSNGAGSIVQTYTYDSFGKQIASSGSLTNPFQFTSREFDPETSLYFYRARYYDAATGRFLNEDSSQYSGDVNLYRYVNNSSTNLIDPLGLNPLAPAIPWWWWPIRVIPWPKVVAGAAGAAAGAAIANALADLAIPKATSSDDVLRKDPLDCSKKDECKKRYANDILWCELNFPEATDPMLWTCYEIADENLARCLDGLPRIDQDPRNKPVPKKPDDPKKPEPGPPIPFPKPRRPRP